MYDSLLKLLTSIGLVQVSPPKKGGSQGAKFLELNRIALTILFVWVIVITSPSVNLQLGAPTTHQPSGETKKTR